MPDFTGTPGPDTISGTEGNDTISGLDGNDTLNGLGGDDLLDGGQDENQLNGGDGNDTVTYSGASGIVSVTLNEDGSGIGSAFFRTDQLNSIESVIGSAFQDFLQGNNLSNIFDGGAGDDFLRAGGGDDTLLGGAGDDFLDGSSGNDFISGGSGYDRATFATGATAGITVNLTISGPQDTGRGMDTLIGVEHLSGTPFADVLTGDDNDNWLWGSTARISGGNVISTTNHDILSGGGGNDLLVVGIGNHTIDGGTGVDTARFTENTATPAFPEVGIVISLALQGTIQASGNGNWLLSNVENLSGSMGNDNLTGDSGANILAGDYGSDILSGGGGNDFLYGDGRIAVGDGRSAFPLASTGQILTFADMSVAFPVPGGNDTLEGGDGDDLLHGGGGNDTASFASSSAAVDVHLGFGTATSAAGNDTLISIENATGSAFDDVFFGDNNANMLSGGDGNDTINGWVGADSLDGGAGADRLTGGHGNDLVQGGTGSDLADFYHFNAAVGGATVSLLLQGVEQFTVGQNRDTLTGIENLAGTPFADSLTGDDGDNWLWGSTLYSPFGTFFMENNDRLDGGGGNDLLTVGIGDHTLIGGTGLDTVRFTENGGEEENLTISLLLQGTAQITGNGSWTLTEIENLSGGIGADKLTGDDFANILAGDLGNDNLIGNDGHDVLIGDGHVQVDSDLIITTFYDSAGGGNDTLNGGKGDDFLYGGGGDDIMKGGPGADRFVIRNSSGDDRVVDFSVGQDKIVFDVPGGPDEFGDLVLTKIHNDVLVTWGTGDSILLEGVRIGQLNASSFEFGVATASSAFASQSQVLGSGFAGFGGHYFEPELMQRGDYLLFG